jgi:hypothetical protein
MNTHRKHRERLSHSDHVEAFWTISARLNKLANEFPDHHVPAFNDEHWLPVDAVLVRLCLS